MSQRGYTKTRRVREALRKSAEERQAAYDKLSLSEKLARLPKDGAKKQRARLTAMMNNDKKAPPVHNPPIEVEEESAPTPKKKAKDRRVQESK